VTAYRAPWDPDPAPVPPFAPELAAVPQPKPRGRRPAAPRPDPGALDWLYHHLTVTGPDEAVRAFAAAARGSGIVPWATDSGSVEEYVFNLAASQPPAKRSLSIEGCRVLARQFRERFEAHHARAGETVGHSQACPFDLHGLLPVPDAILRLGPTDPAALAWSAEHWGVADGVRHVTERPDLGPGRRLPRGHAVIGYGFFTGGDTPHVLVAQLAARWPALRFALRPRPD